MANPVVLNMALPQLPIDKIIGVFSGSFTVPAPTAAQGHTYAEDVQNTGFGDNCLTQAIYSLDNGVTWNDDNMSVPDLSGAFPVLQTADVSSFSQVNQIGVGCTNWYNSFTGTGVSRTVLYKVFALAKSNQGVLEPLATNYKLSYTSVDNYLKIKSQGVISLSIPPSTPTVSVQFHGLGYVPTSRGYVEYSSGRIYPATRNLLPNTGSGGSNNNPIETSIQIDTSNTTYSFLSTESVTDTINLHYRIYYNG